MANRSDRGREQPAVTSRASKPENQNGTSSAETIRASGHDRANRPHTRLHPDQACQTLTKPLQRGSHPHRTFVQEGAPLLLMPLEAAGAPPAYVNSHVLKVCEAGSGPPGGRFRCLRSVRTTSFRPVGELVSDRPKCRSRLFPFICGHKLGLRFHAQVRQLGAKGRR